MNLGYFHFFAFRAYAQAAEQFEKVLQQQPNNTAARFALALAQVFQGNRAESLANFLLVAQQDPANGDYVANAALAARAARRYDEAVALTRRVVQLHPDEPWARLVLVQLEFECHGSTRPVDEFFASLPVAELSSSRGILAQRNWALTKGNIAEALRFESLRKEEGDETNWTSVGRVAAALVAQGDSAAARVRLAKVPDALRARLKLDPPNPGAVWAQLAVAEALLGNKDEALRCARQAVELAPRILHDDQRPAHQSLAFVLAWTGDKAGAIAEYARLLKTADAGLNVFAMKEDPMFYPLRGDPRWEALLKDQKNNAPLF